MKKNPFLLFTLLILIPHSAFSQQAKDEQGTATKTNTMSNSNGKYRIYMADTSEQGLVKQFRDKIDNSETVMDAQVVSKESKWQFFKNDPYFGNRRSIYTVITFKVFHWIKGSIQGDEVTFYLPGGTIGDTSVAVSPSPIYSLDERAFFFLRNKEANTYLIDEDRIPIFGWKNGRHGEVDVGNWQIDSEDYLKVIKQYLSDTTTYQKYIHRMKMAEQERRKWEKGLMNADSVHRAIWQMHKPNVNNDTTKGGAK